MSSESESEMCWICLEEAAEDGSHTLMSPCRCPRKVHPQCLARWQLQQAGRHEEKFCRFCNNELADWKAHLTPEELKPEVSKVQPIMVVYFEGQIHRIPVKQGPDGLTEFTSRIRELFRLPDDVDISLTFGCKEPMSGSHLKLEGVGAFDAAVHCASVAAAERQHKIKKSQSTGQIDMAGAGTGSGTQQGPLGRSASQSTLRGSSGIPTGSRPASASPIAGNASSADRRSRMHAGEQQQPPAARRSRSSSAMPRSRSFTSNMLGGSTSRPSSAEPPAAFRSILSLLGGGGSSSSSNTAVTEPPVSTTTTAAADDSPFAAPSAQSAAGVNGQLQQLQLQQQQQQQNQGAASDGAHVSPQHRGMKRAESSRQSLRNMSQLTDVPEVDESLAAGGSANGISGRLRVSLRSFSRKVARGLALGGGSGGSNGASPTPDSSGRLLFHGSAGSSSSAAAAAPGGDGATRSASVPLPGAAWIASAADGEDEVDAGTAPRALSSTALLPTAVRV